MCWKAIRTQQMRGFSVQPCPLARLPLSWVHCHQWFTEWTVVFLAVAVTVWADWDCIPSIRFFFLHFLHFFLSDVSDSPNIFVVRKWCCTDSVALGHVRYLADGVVKRFKFNPQGSGGNPSLPNDQSEIQRHQHVIEEHHPPMTSNVHPK